MAKPYSQRFIGLGVTMPFRYFLFAYLHKHMNMPRIFSISCASLTFVSPYYAKCISAELEITVPMLVQVDKLVQLIESPVFTCK